MSSQRQVFCLGGVLCAVALLAPAMNVIARADIIRTFGTGVNQFSMTFVTVPGDPDNPNPNDGYGHGSLGYTYQIGKYTVSVNQWNAVSASIVEAGGIALPRSTTMYTAGNQPVNGVSWYAAAEFCNWLTTGDRNSGVYNTGHADWGQSGISHNLFIDRGYRNADGIAYVLPSEDEWYKAAYYDPHKDGTGGYWMYPTRQQSGTPPTPVAGGTTEYTAVYSQPSAVVSAPGQGEVYRPAEIDNAGGLSAYGTMGQGGNIWEWDEALLGNNNDRRGLRGGSYVTGESYMRASFQHNYDPTATSSAVGFRVVSIPEPGSTTMLLAGALGVLLLQRRRNTRSVYRDPIA